TALAAAMLTDPEVLLLDDPLRSVEEEERSRLLAIPGKRRTVVLASAFPATEAGLVNQIALLREGKVVLHAPVRELDARGLTLSLRGIEALAGIGEGAGSAAAGARWGGRPGLWGPGGPDPWHVCGWLS